MTDEILDFYEPLAAYYHLIFEDWNKSIDRQASVLNPILASLFSARPLKILDCACGIGTQAIGFAKFGHRVVASDLSPAAVARAMDESQSRGLDISFRVSNMTSLVEVEESDFDAVVALDNALPHLEPGEVERAIAAMAANLRLDGLFMASIRDYDALIIERPAVQGPAFYGGEGERRIVLQVWDWIDEARYVVHLYITLETGKNWTTHHFVSRYRCLLRGELTNALERAGLKEIRWLTPQESGFYQPIVLARKRRR
ncbi:MAG: class I SAM-dependent methyltransferase [Terracidiphilus sp.]